MYFTIAVLKRSTNTHGNARLAVGVFNNCVDELNSPGFSSD